MSSYSRQQLEDHLKTLSIDNCKVLDIGGSQLPISNRVQVKGKCDFTILDLENPHESKIAPHYVCDIQDTESFEKLGIKNSFNVAFCIEVSEYWYDPITALKNIANTLFDKGAIIISFHFIYPLHKPQGKDYLRYTKYGAIELLQKAGFKIVQYTPRLVRHGPTMWAFYRSEGYKHDKEENPQTLLETGCIIMAQKI